MSEAREVTREIKPTGYLVPVSVNFEDHQTLKRLAETKGVDKTELLSKLIKPLFGYWRLCLAIEATGLDKDDPERAAELLVGYWENYWERHKNND